MENTATVDIDLTQVEEADDMMLPYVKIEARRLLRHGKLILLAINVNRVTRRVQFIWEKVS